MRNLAVVDRQLAELGTEVEPRRVRAMLDRMLGSDRSLARLNEMLDALGPSSGNNAPRPAPLRDPLAVAGTRAKVPRSDPPQSLRPNPPGVRGSLPPRIVSPLAPVQGDSLKTATPWPPVASVGGAASAVRSPRDTLVDAAVPPPAQPKHEEPQFDAATAALFGITAPPSALSGAPPVASPPDAGLPAAGSMGESAAAEAASAATASANVERRVSRAPRSTLLGVGGIDSPAPPAAEPPAAEPLAAAPAAELSEELPRMSTRQLLDQDLDPRDFPSSHPPRARSMPPPLRKAPEVEAQDGFEMLIDDSEEDDIMEIDDVELEEIE